MCQPYPEKLSYFRYLLWVLLEICFWNDCARQIYFLRSGCSIIISRCVRVVDEAQEHIRGSRPIRSEVLFLDAPGISCPHKQRGRIIIRAQIVIADIGDRWEPRARSDRHDPVGWD